MGRTQKLFPRKSKSGRSFQDIEKLGLLVGGGRRAFPRKMINCTPNRGENAFILSKKISPSLFDFQPLSPFSFPFHFFLSFFLFRLLLFAIPFSFSTGIFFETSLFKNWPAIIHSPFSVYQRRSSFMIIPADNRV